MITVGMKLTMQADGLTGEMIVTAIDPGNPDMPFYEGDIVRVHETLCEPDGKTHEYDTFFMSHKLINGVLVFNDWEWIVSYSAEHTDPAYIVINGNVYCRDDGEELPDSGILHGMSVYVPDSTMTVVAGPVAQEDELPAVPFSVEGWFNSPFNVRGVTGEWYQIGDSNA